MATAPKIIRLEPITITGRVPKSATPTVQATLPRQSFLRQHGTKIAIGLSLALALAAMFGKPRRRKNPRRTKHRSNPAPGIAEARDAYQEFHWGIPAHQVLKKQLSPIPKRPLMSLGKLEAVTYSTAKKGDGFSHYHHEFEGDKPLLTIDLDNDRLHVVGGSYTVTKRGIEG